MSFFLVMYSCRDTAFLFLSPRHSGPLPWEHPHRLASRQLIIRPSASAVYPYLRHPRPCLTSHTTPARIYLTLTLPPVLVPRPIPGLIASAIRNHPARYPRAPCDSSLVAGAVVLRSSRSPFFFSAFFFLMHMHLSRQLRFSSVSMFQDSAQ
ncbi:hypothetical protein L226DRAFT_165408 [Lentinus tigrinus ALCF2SS1-7]|uniref:uncharacterized protein n=1 Tax=Lentinus tigrinus ALCF2SS1-7 TaxID=1328758 RepID=UPI00116608F2|nr:hypothetical protein L226DRAFT_165408 [Lentinus tigrinus ALCF2SS1-7]